MSATKSNVEFWAHMAEIVAAFAVVVSVVYLAVQVNEANAELKAQTHYNALAAGNRTFEMVIKDVALGELIDRGLATPDQLTEDEWNRFSRYTLLALNDYEYVFHLHLSDATPAGVWEGFDAYWRGEIQNRPGLRRFWREMAHAYGEPFHSYVDGIVGASGK